MSLYGFRYSYIMLKIFEKIFLIHRLDPNKNYFTNSV